jgi:hypothetical protein
MSNNSLNYTNSLSNNSLNYTNSLSNNSLNYTNSLSNNSLNSLPIYCLNFNNITRKSAMEERFKKVGISDYFMSSGVPLSDPRIDQSLNDHTKKCHSCMFGHLDMIREFLDNDCSPYGIFCEDDIMLDTNFVPRLENIIRDFERMNLDVLLLGYLIPHILTRDSYHEYAPETIWGTQMYMLSRKQARHLINKYANCEIHNLSGPFSADWTITQEGNRRIIYPMLAIEDGTSTYDHLGQAQFHALSHSAHLCSSTYI